MRDSIIPPIAVLKGDQWTINGALYREGGLRVPVRGLRGVHVSEVAQRCQEGDYQLPVVNAPEIMWDRFKFWHGNLSGSSMMFPSLLDSLQIPNLSVSFWFCGQWRSDFLYYWMFTGMHPSSNSECEICFRLHHPAVPVFICNGFPIRSWQAEPG